MLDLGERRGAEDPVAGASGEWMHSGSRIAAGGDGVGVTGTGGDRGAVLGTRGAGWPLLRWCR